LAAALGLAAPALTAAALIATGRARGLRLLAQFLQFGFEFLVDLPALGHEFFPQGPHLLMLLMHDGFRLRPEFAAASAATSASLAAPLPAAALLAAALLAAAALLTALFTALLGRALREDRCG
jgi:hypothetical protein